MIGATYDHWCLATPPEYEREGAIESLIDSEPEMQQLERRVEMADGRCAMLTRALLGAHGERLVRIARLLKLADSIARERLDALLAAIEHWGEQ